MEDSFIIVVRSDDSCSSNTRANFCNIFASPIAIGHYKIAFQSIFIATKFKASTPKLIKIRLEEISPCLSGELNHRDIAVIADKKLTSPPYFYSPKKKEYFDLLHPTLSRLSVCIVDESNKQVQLEDDIEPTLITFKVHRMNMGSNILRLRSKQSMHYFPDNSPASFRIMLSDPLKTGNSQEVALSSIYLPSKIDFNEFIKIRGGLHITVGENRFDFTNDFNTLTTQIFMEAWWRHLQTLARATSSAKDLTIKTTNPSRNEYVVTNEGRAEDIFLTVSYMCAYLFNLDLAGTEMGEEVVLKLTKGGGKLHFKNLKIEKCNPSILMLHCNFVSSTFVGSRQHKLLKVFPYNKKEGNDDMYVKMESPQYDFLPVVLNDNNLFQFELKDVFGNLIPFKKTDNAETFLNLIFREKIKEQVW